MNDQTLTAVRQAVLPRPLLLLLALFAAIALALTGSVAPVNAASGPQTGEWDIVATSQSQNPRLQSYNHDDDVWDTVTVPSAWFAVGGGKVINGDEENGAETPVEGGGIRFENTSSAPKMARIILVIPNGTGLTITDPEENNAVVGSVAVAGGSRTISFFAKDESGAIVIAPGGEAHRHYTWEFSGDTSAVNVRANVRVSGAGGGNYSASTAYRFTF